ncbi:hypothetical protein Y032_0289g1504 [Ancylostoma ceylanicum]|uniref:Uncharacterized protein n=2 Tax=Ancylostoma ceylanicum TaxID=53326 RepID=A0A016S5C6_9BILA|nr:hypothetical protein Y032_0289g1504 [Ancylostoma ceylanicum]
MWEEESNGNQLILRYHGNVLIAVEGSKWISFITAVAQSKFMLYPPNKAEAINNTCATRRNCDALIQILAARTRQCRMELSKWLNFQISAEHQFQIHEVLFQCISNSTCMLPT